MPIKTQVENVLTYLKEQFIQSPLAQNRLAILVWRVLLGMGQDDATHLAAGVAYYAIFSMVPLLLGLLAIFGLVLNSADLQRQFLEFITTNIPGSAGFVTSNVGQIVKWRGVLGIGAIIGSLWLGRAVFAAMSRAINRAWGIRKDRPFYIAIPQQMAMTVILGSLLLVSILGSSVIQLLNNELFGASHQEPILDLGLTYIALYVIPSIITLFTFLLIYRYVPNRKMRWSYVWPGALTAATLFETAKFLFFWYLERFAVYDQLYGSLASVMVFLLWAYFSALILILGAEISYEYERIYYPNDQQNT
ncbi:MAG: YihY/virulence factor BrkB family protein [Chloroflexi bacterium]|nr:YihY/virulence factor BrkB family protein [Chloroflexota bacterium]MDA1219598.1 YihY/virulence factor BrkB family protein [Chloroflexota bacterium]